MNPRIETLLKNGQIRALQEAIHERIHRFNTNWYGISRNEHFVNLTPAVSRAEGYLEEIKELLATLREIDPRNS